MAPLDIESVRARFPGLSRQTAGRPAVFFDGPAGSQVPRRVIDAVADYLAHRNANEGGFFATSVETGVLLEAARRAVADFLGTDDPDTVAFGPNMTSITLALSRALARTWKPGDEVIVTRLDHDANVTPWVLAARDAGAVVRTVEIDPADGTLRLDDFERLLTDRTRLVAVGVASNATGTINPVREIAASSHRAGALVFLDAVHSAPHLLTDVREWGCDFLVCSAYKFFGPHLGVLWGRRELMASLPAYKIRPAPDSTPGRWMTGTANFEGIAGTLAAVDYLDELGRAADVVGSRRASLQAAFAAIRKYEAGLTVYLLEGLARLPAYKVWGIADPARLDARVPTFGLTHARRPARELASALAAQDIYTWHGHFYAPGLVEALGLAPEGLLRVGLLHYNTAAEVDRLLDALAGL